MVDGPGIAFLWWSVCTVVLRGTNNSTSHGITLVLAGGDVVLLQGPKVSQPAGGDAVLAGRVEALSWGRFIRAGK